MTAWLTVAALVTSTALADVLLLDDGAIVINSATSYVQNSVTGVNASGDYTIRQNADTTTNTVVVNTNAGDVAVELDGVNIKTNGTAMEIKSGADVDLTVTGDNTLESGKYYAGLQVDGGADVTIDGKGSLDATGGQGGAGIGGGWGVGTGDIVIEGGEITARGGENAAGIGSGYSATSGGSVVINGGDVDATGGKQGAGIGGGNKDASKTTEVVISDGNVTAQGGQYAAGIGGGNEQAADVLISGGDVEATGAKGGAGIGGGYNGNGGEIVISAGDVTATGSQDASNRGGAGIGGGWGKDGGNIDLTGGDISAQGGANASGVGGGQWGGAGDVLIDGATVEAKGGSAGAGVGGGYKGTTGGTVTIESGDVKATGGMGAAGVGSGDAGNGKSTPVDVNISGGTLVANGGGYGAGIGGGYCTDGGETTITGGDVTATGGKTAAGIGGGGAIKSTNGGKGGDIEISGGNVTAQGGSSAVGIGDGLRSIGTGTLDISGGKIDAKGSDGVKADTVISGGTTVITGADEKSGLNGTTVITGGSVRLNGSASSKPTNGSEELYVSKLTVSHLSSGDSLENAVTISNAPGYGSNDIVVDENKSVYLWTAEGKEVEFTLDGEKIVRDVPYNGPTRGKDSLLLSDGSLIRVRRNTGKLVLNGKQYIGTVYDTETMALCGFDVGLAFCDDSYGTAKLIIYTALTEPKEVTRAFAFSDELLNDCAEMNIQSILFITGAQKIEASVESLRQNALIEQQGLDESGTVRHMGFTAQNEPFAHLRQGKTSLDITGEVIPKAIVRGAIK